MRTKTSTLLGLIILSAALLAGCSGSGKKADTQVVAKVNGKEITVHQLNFMLQRLGPMDEKQAKQAQKLVLDTLVEQEALVQKALADKLDREPKVVQALDIARQQILAQAYLEKQLQGTAPSAAEVRTYFEQHPDLFVHRKVFRFNELVALPRAEQMASVKDKIAHSGNNLAAIASWMRDQKIPVRASVAEHPSEQLPTELLPKLAQMKEGEITTINTQGGLGVMQFVSMREQPVTQDQAKPVIERFLMNQKRVELAKAEIKRVKDEAKVEYVGAFADEGKPVVQAQANKDAPASATKAAESAKVDAGVESMEKGLSGLK
jgi:EpsD family peptidyl-prolyl cis-trans isomerase